jgi:hypothetical protein
VEPVEFVLDDDRLAGRGRAKPHLGSVRRVLVVGVQARSVDGVLDSGARLGDRIGRGDDRFDGIGVGFGGETPDRTLEDLIAGAALTSSTRQ